MYISHWLLEGMHDNHISRECMVIEVNFRYQTVIQYQTERQKMLRIYTQGSELVLESQTTILMMRSELEIGEG